MPAPTQVWYLCDLRSGDVLTELPLDVTGPIRRVLAQVQSQAFSLNVYDDAVPDDWLETLNPGRTMIVQTLDGEPAQAWWLIDRELGHSTVPLNGSTLEECLARTYVPEVYGTYDESEAAAEIATPLVTDYGFTIDYTETGKPTDADYSSVEDVKLLDALTTIMNEGGPEFRVIVQWAPGETRRSFDKVLQIAPKIGAERSDVVFDLDRHGRGTIEDYTRKTTYADGEGATKLVGATDGTGDARTLTDPVYADALIASGWPTVEERHTFTLSPDVVDEDAELLAKTNRLISNRATGTTTWTVTGNEHAPQPGVDFTEGDTITIDVAPQGRQDPTGGNARVRVLGWEYDATSRRVSPVLWEDPDSDEVTGG